MNRYELNLARPRHLFDVQAHVAHALAAVGSLALNASRAVNDAVIEGSRGKTDRCGTEHRVRHRSRAFSQEEHGVTDAWRVR